MTREANVQAPDGSYVPKVNISGEDAYQDVLKRLSKYEGFGIFAARMPGVTSFNYGEDGLGVVMATGLFGYNGYVYISSESAFDIRGYKGDLRISQWPLNPNWEFLRDRKIPDRFVPPIMDFTNKAEAFLETQYQSVMEQRERFKNL